MKPLGDYNIERHCEFLSGIYFFQQMFLVSNKGHGESSLLLSVSQLLSQTCGTTDSSLLWDGGAGG